MSTLDGCACGVLNWADMDSERFGLRSMGLFLTPVYDMTMRRDDRKGKWVLSSWQQLFENSAEQGWARRVVDDYDHT